MRFSISWIPGLGVALFTAAALLGPLAAVSAERIVPRVPGFAYVSPVPGSDRVSPWNNIVLRPGDGDAGALLAALKAEVEGTRSGAHRGEWRISADGASLIFLPREPFAPGELVTVRVGREGQAGTAGQPGASGADGSPGLAFTFTVSSNFPSSAGEGGSIPFDPFAAAADIPGEGAGGRFDAEPSRGAGGGRGPMEGNASATAAACDSLPASYPAIQVLLSNYQNPGGVFLTPGVFAEGDGRLLILDERGLPLFYRYFDERIFDFKLQPNGLLSYARGLQFFLMDSTYTVVDSFATGNGYKTDTHDFQMLPNGNALLMAYDVQIIPLDTLIVGGNPGANVIGLIIQEVDPLGNVVFQWRSWDHFDLLDGTVSQAVHYTAIQVDYVHGNAIEMDDDGNILLCSRHMNEITKIDRQTGDIIWRMGLHALNNQFTFPNDSRGFSHPHDIRRIDNGHLTLFDNGNFLSPEYSRVLEYAVDEDSLVATLVWEYDAGGSIFGPFMGSGQRLADGGTMIGWGGSSSIKVTDLRANGAKAFEILMDPTMWSYRAFRFPWRTTLFTADVDTLDFGTVDLGNSGLLPLVVTNHADSTITLGCFLTTDAAFSVLQAPPAVIAPGDTAILTVAYTPEVDYGDDAELHLRMVGDRELVTQVVRLRGNGGLQVGVPLPATASFSHVLHAPRPNPSMASATIAFELAHADPVSIRVYDVSGRLVRTLLRAELPAGPHAVTWDGRDDRGMATGAGIYFTRLESPAGFTARRLIRLR